MFKELNQRPHRRLNPLTGEWVLVSPHRNLGTVECSAYGRTGAEKAPSIYAGAW